MNRFIYVGDRGEVVGTPHVFTHFGQTVDLDPADARDLVEKGVHLLPESQFVALGENPDRHAAWGAHDAFRQSLVSPQSSPETPAEEKEPNA